MVDAISSEAVRTMANALAARPTAAAMRERGLQIKRLRRALAKIRRAVRLTWNADQLHAVFEEIARALTYQPTCSLEPPHRIIHIKHSEESKAHARKCAKSRPATR